MSDIKLLLDEDVWTGLGQALRQSGYDAISINEINRKGLPDEEQLTYAITEGRAILTHNIQDFAKLAVEYFEHNISHPGIIVSRHYEKGTLLHRALDLLNSLTPEGLANTLRFV